MCRTGLDIAVRQIKKSGQAVNVLDRIVASLWKPISDGSAAVNGRGRFGGPTFPRLAEWCTRRLRLLHGGEKDVPGDA